MVERTHGKVAAGEPAKAVAGGMGSPTFAGGYMERINWRIRQTWQPRFPAWGNKTSKPLTE